MIRLHWWNGRPNFGDELSRIVCERLSKRWTDWAPFESADLLGIGSLLATHLYDRGVLEQYRGYVWGTGCMVDRDHVSVPAARIVAVRGPLTAEQLRGQTTESPVLGEPGLFARELTSSLPNPRYVLGVIPHWSESKHPFFASPLVQRSDVTLIDPAADAMSVIGHVSQCQHIASSSLHGLVVADSLGIPNCWMRLETGHEDRAGSTRFKFRDYFLGSSGVDNREPIQPDPKITLDGILSGMQCLSEARVNSICSGLRDVFPFSPL